MATTPQTPLMTREEIEEKFPVVEPGGVGELKRNPDSHLGDALAPHGVTYRLEAIDNHDHRRGLAERSVGPDVDQHTIETIAIDLMRDANLDLSKTD